MLLPVDTEAGAGAATGAEAGAAAGAATGAGAGAAAGAATGKEAGEACSSPTEATVTLTSVASSSAEDEKPQRLSIMQITSIKDSTLADFFKLICLLHVIRSSNPPLQGIQCFDLVVLCSAQIVCFRNLCRCKTGKKFFQCLRVPSAEPL